MTRVNSIWITLGCPSPKLLPSADHPSQRRLASQHELARAYQVPGQAPQEVELLEHVVKIQEATLAKDHPDRLVSERALTRVARLINTPRESFLRHLRLLQFMIRALRAGHGYMIKIAKLTRKP